MEKRSRIQILFSLAMLLLFGALFLAGTFFDESLAAAFYSPGNTVIGIITSTGVYPFFSAFVLFSGALFERALHCVKNKPLKIVLCIVCIAVAAYLGYFAGELLASKSCFGYFFPSVIGNFPVIAGICLIFEYPLFFLGYRLARTSDDKLLVRRIIGLFVILALAYVTMTMLKSTFPRPRYR
ncbi:MAG: hypothetical protein IK093_08510, partial [Ruminiclostridium sp.]|nr:hypothetical protein [Ruminiclostridium sp.]